MKKSLTNIGWVVHNGSGWNHHITADILNEMLASSPDELPVVPPGYGVLVAPISDKPFGLRCALVKIIPRFTDEEGVDDGCDGHVNGWVSDRFGLDAEIIKSARTEQQSDDESQFVISIMRKAIALLKL